MYNPCCKYPLKNPPLPIFKKGANRFTPIDAKKDNLGYLYNDFPDLDELDSNATDFPKSDLEFIKELYNAGEGSTNIDEENLEDALAKANHFISPETRCYLCRRNAQFSVYSFNGEKTPASYEQFDFHIGSYGIESTATPMSFMMYVNLNKDNDDVYYFFKRILNCEEFGFDEDGGNLATVPADSLAGKFRDGCAPEEEIIAGKNIKNSDSFKNLCDIILAETIKSYLL